MNKKNISIDMVVQNYNEKTFYDFSFTVSKEDSTQVKDIYETFNREISCSQLHYSTVFSKVSVVGLGINNHPKILGRFLKCLDNIGITIMSLTTSQMKISCLIDDRFSKKAVQSLLKTFFPDTLDSKNL
jgi:aspartate kinase